MSNCCGGHGVDSAPTDTCASAAPCCGSESVQAPQGPLGWFAEMIPHCLKYAQGAKAEGKPIVGIMCEYTPRELIMAAGGVPVCLCGGSASTILDAEQELPANLCPLIKSTYGYHVRKSNPFLEMADLVVAETTCDGKKKMYELLAESRPMHVLELPHKQDDANAFEYWVLELEKLKSSLEERFSVEITDGKLKEAIARMNEERSLRRQLADLMKEDAPPLTGRELLSLKSSISCIPCDIAQYGEALWTLNDRPDKPDTAGRPRVLLTGVPLPHGAERVLDIVEDCGGLVVCMETCTGVKPVMEDVGTENASPLRAIAEKYFHLPCSVMTTNDRRLKSLEELVVAYRPDCVIELVWQNCLTYDVESSRIRRLVKDKLNLPYLQIGTDYSPSDSARIAVRVEALFEIIAERGCPAS